MLPSHKHWVQGLDLNQGPSGYEPDELPDCSTLQHLTVKMKLKKRGDVKFFFINCEIA